MRPLNHCLAHYQALREKDPTSPRWLMVHDTDEYIYSDKTDLAIWEVLGQRDEKCCTQVRLVPVAYGHRLAETSVHHFFVTISGVRETGSRLGCEVGCRNQTRMYAFLH